MPEQFEGSAIDKFTGNVLSAEEKAYRMERLERTIADDDFDIEIDRRLLPYLRAINEFPFIMTTQSCWGHYGDDGRKAHVDFRSALSEKDTINLLLRPLTDRFYNVTVHLYMEASKLRYCLWLESENWRAPLDYFLQLLAKRGGVVNGDTKGL